MDTGAEKLLRRPEVLALVGLRTSCIYKRMSLGSFPKPVQLGGRIVAWRASDIQAWIASRPVNGEARP